MTFWPVVFWFVFIPRYWVYNWVTRPHVPLYDVKQVLSFSGGWLKFRFVVKFCELKKCENVSYTSNECHRGNTFTLYYTLLGELPGLLVSVFSIFKVFMDLPPNCNWVHAQFLLAVVLFWFSASTSCSTCCKMTLSWKISCFSSRRVRSSDRGSLNSLNAMRVRLCFV